MFTFAICVMDLNNYGLAEEQLNLLSFDKNV